MAITVTKQTLVDGERNVVVKLDLVSDAAADVTDQVLVSKADYTGTFTDLKIMAVQAGLVGFSMKLTWDATANVDALDLPEGEDVYDFHLIGGLINNAGTGKTGDILFSTTGAASGERATLILEMRKRG